MKNRQRKSIHFKKDLFANVCDFMFSIDCDLREMKSNVSSMCARISLFRRKTRELACFQIKSEKKIISCEYIHVKMDCDEMRYSRETKQREHLLCVCVCAMKMRQLEPHSRKAAAIFFLIFKSQHMPDDICYAIVSLGVCNVYNLHAKISHFHILIFKLF